MRNNLFSSFFPPQVFFIDLVYASWAFGVAEPCSRFRKYGGALSEPFGKAQDKLREFAPPPEPTNRAGDPKGHITVNMVLGPFAETKGPRLPGRNPAISLIAWT